MKTYERERMIRNEGLTAGKAEDIQTLLSDLGPIPEELATRIDNEKDPATLNRWLKLAARANSLKEFAEEIS